MSLGVIATNFATGYAGNLVLIVTGFLTKILLARLVAPADLGVFIIAQTIIGFATFAASLGFADAVVRYVALSHVQGNAVARRAVGSALTLSIPVSLLVALVFFLWAEWIGRSAAPGEVAFPAVLSAMALWVPFKIAADTFGAMFQGMGKYWIKVTVADVFPALLFLGVLSILLLVEERRIATVAVGYTASIVCAGILLTWAGGAAVRDAPLAKSPGARDLLRFGLPLLGGGILAWPLAFVPVLIGSLIGSEAVAYYSLAISLAAPIYLGTAVAESATIGVWSGYVGQNRLDTLIVHYKVVTRWGLVLAALIFAPLFFDATDVVNILLGEKFQGTAAVLPAIALVTLLNVVTGPNESILKALGCTRWIFLTRLAVGATVVATIYPLVRFYTLGGAVSSYFLAVLVGMGMYGGFLYRRYRIHPIDKLFVRTLIAVVIALLVELPIARNLPGDMAAVTRLALIFGTYTMLFGTLLYFGGGVTEEDRTLARKLMSRFGR